MAVTRNKSSIFILPMVTGIPYKYFEGFINCYVGCNHGEEIHKRIYVAFRIEDLSDEDDRVKILEDNDLYIKTFDVEDYRLFVFKPNPLFENDFDYFIEGKYSKFSDKYKEMLKKLYPTIDKLKAIINPTDLDREILAKELMCSKDVVKGMEIYSVPENIEESFTLAHFLEIE